MLGVLPKVGLGTDKLYAADQMDSAVQAALNTGYRLFDTARAYGNESLLGDALEKFLKENKTPREEIFITTKILIPSENIEQNIRSDVADSCKNLKTNYIDLILIHYPKCGAFADEDPKNAEMRKEAYTTLQKLKEEGVVKNVGVSNYEIRHIDEIEKNGLPLPAIHQLELHPHFTRKELVDYCKNKGIIVQAFTSLARHNEELLGSSIVKELAQKHQTSVTSILLAWATSQDFGIIPKSANPKRIKENWSAGKLELTADEIVGLSSLNKNQNYVGRCTGWKVL